MTTPSDDKFTLPGGDAEFGSRAKNIFAGLESLEAQHIAVESSDAARHESYALMKPDPTDEFSSTSGPNTTADFQVPSQPPPKRIRSSSKPGYETSPSKWKMYDLSDVSASQLTEQSNQKAARDFFNRLQDPPDDATEITDADTDADRKHVFRKPNKKPDSKNDCKRPADEKHCEMEETEDDFTRTQILSFADDENINEGRQTVTSTAQFRRRRVRKTADRLRSHTTDDDNDDDDVVGTAKTEHESHNYEEIPSLVDNSQRNSEDSEPDSDNFSELAQLGSDSDHDEEDSYYKSHPERDNIEQYVPEDVDLDSID